MRPLCGLSGFVFTCIVGSLVLATNEVNLKTPNEIQVLTDAGDNAAAATAARHLLDDRERRYGSRSLPVAEALDLLVRALARDGQGTKAERLALAQRALAIKTELLPPDHVDLAPTWYVLGLVNYLGGTPAEAERPFRTALELVEAHYGAGHPETEFYLREYGATLMSLGQPARALPLLERLRDVSRLRHGTVGHGTLAAHYNLALTYVELGRYDDAEESAAFARQALDAAEVPDPATAGLVDSLRATMLVWTGRFAEARAAFDELLIRTRRLYGEISLETLTLTNSVAANMTLMGDSEAALELLNRVIPAAERVPSVSSKLRKLRYNRAVALERNGSPEAALEELDHLLQQAREQGLPEMHIEPVRMERARALAALQNREAARDELQLALRAMAARGAGRTVDYAEGLLLLSRIELDTQQFNDARRHLQEGMALLNETAAGQAHGFYFEAREQLAALERLEGNTERAFDLAASSAVDRAFFDRNGIGRLPEQEGLARAHVPKRGFDLLVDLVSNTAEAPVEWRTRALEVLMLTRGTVFDQIALRRQLYASQSESTRDRVEELDRARTRLANVAYAGRSLPLGPRMRQLAALRETISRLERELLASTDGNRSASHPDPSLEMLRNALGDQEALVSFVRFVRVGAEGNRPRFAACVVHGDTRSPTWIDLGSAASIEHEVESWRAMFRVQNGRLSSMEELRRRGGRLRSLIWDPIASRLQGATLAYLVPDGVLHTVGFAALPTEDGMFLIERGPLFHYLTTERDLLGNRRSTRTSSDGMLAVGDPKFRSRRAKGSVREEGYRGNLPVCNDFRTLTFASLPGARLEVRRIASIWESSGNGPAKVVIGSGATEAWIKDRIGDYRVVHLATHGFFLDPGCGAMPGSRGISGLAPAPSDAAPAFYVDNPMLRAGLAFAGANHRDSGRRGSDVEDGVLTAEEIATLDLSNVELAVLSACRTAAGRPHDGEGMFGLQRAFLIAGAGTIVTNLWEVGDASTAGWMESFYRHRVEDRMDATLAARQASLEGLQALRRSGQDPHPFHWGGWLVTGRGR